MDKIQMLIHVSHKFPDDKNTFILIICHLIQHGCIHYDKSYYLTEEHSKNAKNAVKRLVALLSDESEEIYQSIYPEIRTTNEWENLISSIKSVKKNTYEFLTFPDYVIEKKKIKIEQILVSTEIIKYVQKSGILKLDMEESPYDYLSFYKFFNENYKKIVVQGAPGMGKTVQFRNLSYLWANDKWQGFNGKLLLNIKVRDIENDQDLHDIILRQNFSTIDYINKSLLKIIMKEKADEIILFIDGADELGDDENEELKNWIECKRPNIQTVVWTRKWKTNEILYDLLFELKGFNTSQLEEFLLICFRDRIRMQAFMEQLNKMGDMVKNLARIPLLALNLYILHSNFNCDLKQKTRFDIFTNIFELINFKTDINSVLMRKMQRECLEQLSNQYIKLKLTNKEIIELQSTIGDISEINQIIEKREKFTKVEFYHLSFQEYLAAKFILNESKKRLFLFKKNKIMNKIQTRNIINLMDFIKTQNLNLYIKLSTSWDKAKQFNNLNSELKKYFYSNNSFEKINLLNDKPYNDDIILLAFEKQSRFKELHLSVDYQQTLTVLLKINDLCAYLNILNLQFQTGNYFQKRFSFDIVEFFKAIFKHSSMKSVNINDVYFINIYEDLLTLSIMENNGILNTVCKRSNFELCLDVKITTNKLSTIIIEFLIKNKNQILCLLTNSSEYLEIFTDNEKGYLLKDIFFTHSINRYIYWKLHIENNYNVKLFHENILYYFNDDFSPKNFKDLSRKLFIKLLSSYLDIKNICLESIGLNRRSENFCSNFICLESIDLSGNFIQSTYFIFLLEIFNKKLKKMIFSNCELTFHIKYYVKEKLMQFSNIYEVDFSHNKCLRSGCIDILRGLEKCKNSLQIIKFSDCGLTEKDIYGLESTLLRFTNISFIDFSDNEQLKTGCLMILRGLINSKLRLKTLILFNCGLNLENKKSIVKILVEFKFLTHINLKTNSNSIKCSQFTSNKLSAYTKSVFFYSFCLISDRPNSTLLNLRLIKTIDFNNNSAVKFCFKDIMNALKMSKTTLENILFSNCNLTVKDVLKVEKILNYFNGIKKIDLSCNKILKSGFECILKGLINSESSLRVINFSECGINEENRESIEKHLSKFSNLTNVCFSKNPIRFAFLNIMRGLTNSKFSLKILNFSNCDISDDILKEIDKSLSKFTCIKKIDFSSNSSLEWGLLIVLNSLNNSNITISNINFSNCWHYNRMDLMEYSKNYKFRERLQRQTFLLQKSMGTEFHNVFYFLKLTLKDFHSINKIDLSFVNLKMNFNSVLVGLQFCGETLEKMIFKHCNIFDFDTYFTVKILHCFVVVKDIDFSENFLTEEGIVNILKGLMKCKYTLRSINFSHNFSQNNYFLFRIKNILSEYNSIEEVNFSNTFICQSWLYIIKGLLNSGRTLKKIDFSYNSLIAKDLFEIEKYLDEFFVLQELDFRHNDSSLEDFFVFVEKLKNSEKNYLQILLDET